MPDDQSVAAYYREMGGLIKQRREAVRMTQMALGQSLKLTRASVSNIEAGRQRVQAHVVAHIALVLGCPASELWPSEKILRQPLDTISSNGESFIDESSRSFVEDAMKFANPDRRDP